MINAIVIAVSLFALFGIIFAIYETISHDSKA